MAEDARPAELRGLLAEALHRRLCAPLTGGDQPCQSCRDDADALLPVVESYAAQKAAEELLKVVRDHWRRGVSPSLNVVLTGDLTARAAALSPATEKEKR